MTDAVLSVWTPERVGVRLSPLSAFNDIDDSNPVPLFSYVVDQLGARNLGYVHVIEGNTGGPRETGRDFDFDSPAPALPQYLDG